MQRPIYIVILFLFSQFSLIQAQSLNPEMEKQHEEFRKNITSEGNTSEKEIQNNANQFIEFIQQGNKENIVEMVADEVKKLQSPDDIVGTLSMYETFYGKIKNFEPIIFGIKQRMGFGKLATVTYDVQFEKYKGKANGIFKIVNQNDVRMLSFNMGLEDYTQLEKISSIASPALNAIRLKDKKKIYDLTSSKFKEYHSIFEFETMMDRLYMNNLKGIKMYRHQMGVRDGVESINVFYEPVDKAGFLQLNFSKREKTFELEGVQFITQ